MKFNRIMAIAIMAILLIVFAPSAEKRAAGTPLRIEGALKSKEIAAPGTPANGYGYWYFTTAGLATAVNDSGVSTTLGTTDSIWGHGAIITTDISPLVADEDMLLCDGSTIGWGAANPGAIDVWLTRISDGILSITGTAAAAGLRYLEAAANGTNYTAWDAPANLAGDVTTHMFATALVAGDLLYASAANQPAGLAKSTVPGVAIRNTGGSNVPAYGPVQVLLYSEIAPAVAPLAGTDSNETALTPATVEGSGTLAVAGQLAGACYTFDATIVMGGDADSDEAIVITGYSGTQLLFTTASIAVDGAVTIFVHGNLKIRTVGAGGTGIVSGIWTDSLGATKAFSTAITNYNTTATHAFVIKGNWAGTTDAADTASLEDVNISLNNVD